MAADRASAVLTRPAVPPSWAGDPSVLVYAVRYALTIRGHVPSFVEQAIALNAALLPPAARRLIVRDVKEWLSYAGADQEPATRAVWIAVLAHLDAS